MPNLDVQPYNAEDDSIIIEGQQFSGEFFRCVGPHLTELDKALQGFSGKIVAVSRGVNDFGEVHLARGDTVNLGEPDWPDFQLPESAPSGADVLVLAFMRHA